MLALHSVPAHIYIEGAIYFNITGTGPVRTVKTNIWFFNLENWTVDVDVTAYWDNTTEIIGTEHITDVTILHNPAELVTIATPFSHTMSRLTRASHTF